MSRQHENVQSSSLAQRPIWHPLKEGRRAQNTKRRLAWTCRDALSREWRGTRTWRHSQGSRSDCRDGRLLRGEPEHLRPLSGHEDRHMTFQRKQPFGTERCSEVVESPTPREAHSWMSDNSQGFMMNMSHAAQSSGRAFQSCGTGVPWSRTEATYAKCQSR